MITFILFVLVIHFNMMNEIIPIVSLVILFKNCVCCQCYGQGFSITVDKLIFAVLFTVLAIFKYLK